MKQKQITLYEVLEVLAKAWIGNVSGYYIHDDSDSMHALEGYEDAFERVAREFEFPSTMIVFVKAHLKKEYIAAVKEYLNDNGEDFEEYASNLPIKITKKDYDAA
jgi:hypothetical protein